MSINYNVTWTVAEPSEIGETVHVGTFIKWMGVTSGGYNCCGFRKHPHPRWKDSFEIRKLNLGRNVF